MRKLTVMMLMMLPILAEAQAKEELKDLLLDELRIAEENVIAHPKVSGVSYEQQKCWFNLTGLE